MVPMSFYKRKVLYYVHLQVRRRQTSGTARWSSIHSVENPGPSQQVHARLKSAEHGLGFNMEKIYLSLKV